MHSRGVYCLNWDLLLLCFGSLCVYLDIIVDHFYKENKKNRECMVRMHYTRTCTYTKVIENGFGIFYVTIMKIGSIIICFSARSDSKQQ